MPDASPPPTDDPRAAEIDAAIKRMGLDKAPPAEPVGKAKQEPERLDLLDFRAAFEEYAEEEKRGRAGAIMWDWPTIDHDRTGLGKPVRPGEVIIVGARTGIGKTWVAQHATERALRYNQEIGAVNFTMEMAGYQMAERFSARAMDVTTRQLTQDVIADRTTADHVLAIAPWLERLRFFEQTTSVETIPKAIDLAEEELGIPVGLVVIDYTQLLAWKGARNMTLTEQATVNARALKDVTKQRRVITIACAQLSRAGGGSGFQEPSMDALRESGAAEEAADRILMFWRAKQSKDENGEPVKNPEHEIRVKVEKNRHGPRGARATLRYNHSMRLEEVSDYDPAQKAADASAARDDAPEGSHIYDDDIPF